MFCWISLIVFLLVYLFPDLNEILRISGITNRLQFPIDISDQLIKLLNKYIYYVFEDFMNLCLINY